MHTDPVFIAIDLKSFYASVECVERGLDPLDACLVVADRSRSDRTICLAVSPALKAFGVPGRPRLYEALEQVARINQTRGRTGYSNSGRMLGARPDLKVDFIVATPRMKLYLDYSARIVDIYHEFIAPEDIHVYSVDEVFIDATPYLKSYRMTPQQLATAIITRVLQRTGITATVGIGSNMFLCKVAMDIVAKKMKPDANGVRIASLNVHTFREKLWAHTPLTDFWRIGPGIARRLEQYGMFTMGDIARRSLTHQGWFYRQFGVCAELLIDHAWGLEPVTMAQVKAYRPEAHSLSQGQVLIRPYKPSEALDVILEMAYSLCLELSASLLATAHITLVISYHPQSLSGPKALEQYNGPIHITHDGRRAPHHGRGAAVLKRATCSFSKILSAVTELFNRIVNADFLIARVNLCFDSLMPITQSYGINPQGQQLELFTSVQQQIECRKNEDKRERQEFNAQKTIAGIRRQFGANAVLCGANFSLAGTGRERNTQIGGHKA